MPYAMTMSNSTFSDDGGDGTATATISVYDATGWQENTDGSLVPPNPLPTTPYVTVQVTIHNSQPDGEAIAMAGQMAAAAVRHQQTRLTALNAYQQRVEKYRGVFLPVPGVG